MFHNLHVLDSIMKATIWQRLKAVSYANSKPRKAMVLLLTILTAMTAKTTEVVTMIELLLPLHNLLL